jgi:transposase
MKPYSVDLRERVLAACDEGMGTAEAAEAFAVSPSWVRKLKQQRRETGSIAPRVGTPGPKPALAPHAGRLRALVRDQPDRRAAEYRDPLGVGAAPVTVWRVLRRLGLTHKKVLRAAEQDRPDVAAARDRWRAEVMPGLDPRKLVFIDETGARTNMSRARGSAPRGERLAGTAPHGHWHTTTFVGALTARGFIAPMVVDGAVNGGVFRAYVEQVLVPELRPGRVVVMDNLGSHTLARVRAAVGGAGCRLLFLPPYSPDLNPIENAFSKLKELLRQAAERTVDGLWATIGRLLDRFSPAECRNYFRHCGYRQPATRS